MGVGLTKRKEGVVTHTHTHSQMSVLLEETVTTAPSLCAIMSPFGCNIDHLLESSEIDREIALKWSYCTIIIKNAGSTYLISLFLSLSPGGIITLGKWAIWW